MSILVQQLPFSAIELQQIMRRTAALDIIFCEEAWLRLHSYRQGVGEAEAIGWINNGAGDSLHSLRHLFGEIASAYAGKSAGHALLSAPLQGLYQLFNQDALK